LDSFQSTQAVFFFNHNNHLRLSISAALASAAAPLTCVACTTDLSSQGVPADSAARICNNVLKCEHVAYRMSQPSAQPAASSSKLSCSACQKVVGKAESVVIKRGCGAVFDAVRFFACFSTVAHSFRTMDSLQFPSCVTAHLAHTQEAIGLCEAAGFGPEDPASEICAAAVISGCKVIAKDLANHITDPHRICQDMDLCPK
jgi:hypothetical protein